MESDGQKITLKSAVGITFDNYNNVLLGLAIGDNSDDERDGKWCFCGGGIDEGENVIQAAIRETYEESGILTKPMSLPILIHPSKPAVGFVCLTQSVMSRIVHNNEFVSMRWFNLDRLPENLMPLNKEILISIGK